MRKFESSQKDESRTKFLESFQNYLSTLTHHRLIAARLGDSSELSRSILIFRLFAIPASSSVCHVARFVKFSCENFLFPEILVTRYRTTTFTAEKRSGSSPPLRADNIALNFRHVTQCASHRKSGALFAVRSGPKPDPDDHVPWQAWKFGNAFTVVSRSKVKPRVSVNSVVKCRFNHFATQTSCEKAFQAFFSLQVTVCGFFCPIRIGHTVLCSRSVAAAVPLHWARSVFVQNHVRGSLLQRRR